MFLFRCGNGELPVDGLGGKFVRGGGFDGIDPTWLFRSHYCALWNKRLIANSFAESSSLAREMEGGERTWDWEFSLSLQESGICGDKLLGLFVEIQD